MVAEEKLVDKIVRLSEELRIAREQMNSCPHQFLDPVLATREYKVPYFVRYEPHGSDPEPVYDYVPKTEHGWKRTCNLCGYSEYTAKTKPIVKGHEPDFGGK